MMAAGRSMSFPVVSVPPQEPLQTCAGCSPGFPAWPEQVKWYFIEGTTAPWGGQDVSLCGLKGSCELLVSLTFSPLDEVPLGAPG